MSSLNSGARTAEEVRDDFDLLDTRELNKFFLSENRYSIPVRAFPQHPLSADGYE